MWLAGWVAMGAIAAPEGADAIAKALSGRHVRPCNEVEALSAAPADALVWVVDHVQQPPWAGMRAARCLIEGHVDEVEPRLHRWVTDPTMRGLGRLVIAHLDTLPPTLAHTLAMEALREGPEPARTSRALKRLETPELRALVPE